MKVGYLLKLASGSQNLRDIVQKVRTRSGKPALSILLDMLHCAKTYGAGFHDYLIFGWETIPEQNRGTYLTRIRNKKLIEKVNDPETAKIFDFKDRFYQRFAAYLGRDFRVTAGLTEEDFARFVAGKDFIIAKPSEGECGHGIEKIAAADHPDLREFYEYVMDPQKHFGVIEDVLEQHEDLNRLYPCGVNTMRVTAIIGDDGTPHVLYVTCKMGNLGKFVDNMENDGLSCPVDMATGKICGVAHTSKLVNLDTHPYTGVKLVGYPLPYIQETIALVEKAMLEEPKMRYVGWDIAITPTGPAVVEGNNYPGYDFSQLPEHTPDRIGTLADIQKYVKEIE